MSVQKAPDQRGGIDNGAIDWEEDLKPFTRLPREEKQTPRQRVPALIPGLISLVIIIGACAFVAKFVNDNRPALSNLALAPTATFAIITPTPTDLVPPTATPYMAPTDTPAAPTAAAAGTTNDPISVGAKVKIVDTGPTGLNFRKTPARAGEKIRSLGEGNVYEVVGGPQQADGLTWWQLKDPSDGTSGWGAADYMKVVLTQ
jgi:hypothetical protein